MSCMATWYALCCETCGETCSKTRGTVTASTVTGSTVTGSTVTGSTGTGSTVAGSIVTNVAGQCKDYFDRIVVFGLEMGHSP